MSVCQEEEGKRKEGRGGGGGNVTEAHTQPHPPPSSSLPLPLPCLLQQQSGEVRKREKQEEEVCLPCSLSSPPSGCVVSFFPFFRVASVSQSSEVSRPATFDPCGRESVAKERQLGLPTVHTTDRTCVCACGSLFRTRLSQKKVWIFFFCELSVGVDSLQIL